MITKNMKYTNLLIYLICDGLGENPENVWKQQNNCGFVELEKKDYFQIISKFEDILDINTGWLTRPGYNIDIIELSKLAEKIKIYKA